MRARIEDLLQQLDEQRAAHEDAVSGARHTAALLAASRTAERHANDRARGGTGSPSRQSSWSADTALQRAQEATGQRDALLADRAEHAGVGLAAAQVAELRTVAQSAALGRRSA